VSISPAPARRSGCRAPKFAELTVDRPGRGNRDDQILADHRRQADRQRNTSGPGDDRSVDPQRSDRPTPKPLTTRGERQRAEILALVAKEQLQRAADLAHEHLAEFPDDRCVRSAVATALDATADPDLRRRAAELPPP
jgi:hypothetical protein